MLLFWEFFSESKRRFRANAKRPSKLNVKLASLMGVVAGADAAPTTQSEEVFASLSARVDAQLQRLADLVEREVPRFNALVRELELPALTVTGSGGER